MKKNLLSIIFALISTLGFSQAPNYVPVNGLVGWWPFNGNADDESGNGNNGTNNGATLTTDRNGVENQAYSFDGVDDYISILRNYQGSFTTSIWFNSNGNSQYKPLIDAFDVNWEIQIMNSFLAYVSFDNSSNLQVFNSSVLITNNNWNNLICTYNSNILNFYLNGTQIDQFTVNTLPINSGNYFLGASQTGSDQYFEGKLDDIGIWNRALTQQEITNLYTSTVPVSCLPAYVPTSGLVGYWPFCGNANDESGNGNNGTVNGATLTTDRNNNLNSAYLFNRLSSQSIDISNNTGLNNITELTLSIWYNIQSYNDPSSCCGYNHFINKSDQLTLNQFILGGNNTGLYFYYDNSNAFQTNTLTPLNQWNNVILTYEYNGSPTSMCRFYLNGVMTDAYPTSSQLIASNLNLRFGTYGSYLYNVVDGTIDDIGIWNRALTECEIQNLYTSQLNSTFVSAGADQTICNGQQVILSASNSQNYSWNNGVTDSIPFYPTTTQDYIVTADSANCQSSDTVTIFVNEPISSIQIETACDSYTWNGTSYTASGVYTGTTTNCVTESLNLTIAPSSTNTISASACDSYFWNGTTYSASGVYTGTTTNCVTESLNLTITPSSTNTTAASACDSYAWNGQTYTQSGVYTGTTTDCVTQSLNLTITPSSTNTTTASACNNYTWNGQAYTQTGIYTGTTTNCVTESLNLTITPSSTNTTTASACNSYTWNEQTYTQSGVYAGNTANCVTQALNLTITPSSTNTTTASACNSYVWNGTSYSASGVYTGTTANCVTQSLNLTITPSSTNTTTASACDSYSWNGTTYTATGVYTGTTTNCVTESLNLTITPSSTNTTAATACDSYTWNGQTYTQSGVYTGATANCVTQFLNLSITPSSTITQPASQSINISNNAQFIVGSSGSNAIYQWQTDLGIGFQNLNSVGQYSGTSNNTLTVSNVTFSNNNQPFRCIISSGSCTDTSDVAVLTVLNNVGFSDLSASKLSIYPNPTNGDFTITGLELVGTVSSLTLTDMNGKVVKVLDTKATKFSMASIKPGVYFLNIISENKQEVLKIVKE